MCVSRRSSAIEAMTAAATNRLDDCHTTSSALFSSPARDASGERNNIWRRDAREGSFSGRPGSELRRTVKKDGRRGGRKLFGDYDSLKLEPGAIHRTRENHPRERDTPGPTSCSEAYGMVHLHAIRKELPSPVNNGQG